jgi:thiamine biosynthesis lipoprotein
MQSVRLALQAMATRFELVLQGEDAVRLRAAGEEALSEVRRLEARLSFYRPTSEVSRLNARAAHEPVRVTPALFGLLREARRLYDATGGAFDVTVAPLMRCWGFVNDTGHLPDPAALAEARSRTGMHLVTLDEHERTVRFGRPGVLVDLGGIGKGYAIDEAVLLLREAGITRAFLHGGTSTVYALGRPADADAWKVALPHPNAQHPNAQHPDAQHPDAQHSDTGEPGTGDLLAVVPLEDEALSVSAVSGKAFTVAGKTYGHVLDPREGRPVMGAVLAAVVTPSATAADALSTALLVEGPAAWERGTFSEAPSRALVVQRAAGAGGPTVHRTGLALWDPATNA